MLDSTVPVTVVPHAVSQELVFCVRIRIMRLRLGWSWAVSYNLVFLSYLRAFCTSPSSSLTVLVWSVVENSPFPITALTDSTLMRCEISHFLRADVTRFWIPRTTFLTFIVLKVSTMGGGGGSSFQKIGEERKFCREIYPLPWRKILYPSSSIAGISILIGSHEWWLSIFPVDIWPQFRWFYWSFSTKPPSVQSANPVWKHHTQ